MIHQEQTSKSAGAGAVSKNTNFAPTLASQATFNPEELFTSKQLADFLKVSERLPESWRSQGTGPRYIRVGGRRVVYRWADVSAYLAAQTFSSTSQETAHAA